MDSHQFSDADEEKEIPYKVLTAKMLQINQLEATKLQQNYNKIATNCKINNTNCFLFVKNVHIFLLE